MLINSLDNLTFRQILFPKGFYGEDFLQRIGKKVKLNEINCYISQKEAEELIINAK